ncbi:hypothetical protein ZWY2020_029644 [Hordeum vulgare]|nr:hypothetical protein ZWY2020_029644 [Hordeum vulgare]
MGLAHGGVGFSKGALSGSGSYAVGIMTKSRRGKYYIDNSLWGPEVDSIESGYRVPFGTIQVFIGMFGAPVPEPDTFADIVEPARGGTASAKPGGQNETGGSSKAPAQVRADLAAETAKVMTIVVTTENQETINIELAKLREEMAKAQQDVEAEAARMAM